MSLSNARPIRRIGTTFGYLAQYGAGLLLAAGAVRHATEAGPFTAYETWSSDAWSQAQLAVITAILALWFLLPRLFERSLLAGHGGRARIVAVLVLLAILTYLLSFAVWIVHDRTSPLRGVVPQTSLIYAFAAFAMVYLYAFVYPGRAFDRVEPVYVPQAVYRSLGPVQVKSAFRLASILRRAGALLLLGYWAAGIFGLYRATWLPDPAHLDRVDRFWTYLAMGAVIVSIAITSGRVADPATGAPRSATGRRMLLPLLAALLSVAVLTPSLTRGLPWVASFALSDGPGSVDVIVLERAHEGRRSICSQTVTVVVPTAPDRAIPLCSVPDDLWSGLRSGSRLRLEGTATPYGLRYTAITRQ